MNEENKNVRDDGIHNRVGKFQISIEAIEEMPQLIKEVMGRCIIIRAERLEWQGVIDYIAYCSDFALVLPGLQIPEYRWSFHTEDDVTKIIGVERCHGL